MTETTPLTGVQLEDRERPLFEQAIKKSPSHSRRDLTSAPWGYKNNAVQHLWEGWMLNVKFREGRS